MNNMKIFRTPQGIFAIEEDGSQDHLVKADWQQIAKSEADAILNPPPTSEQIQLALQAQALFELVQVTRWQAAASRMESRFQPTGGARDEVLRDVVRGVVDTIPPALPFPAGS